MLTRGQKYVFDDPQDHSILAIDDDPVIYECLPVVLEFFSGSILRAHGAAAGIDKLFRHRHELSLVVCDFSMPHGDGFLVRQMVEYINPKIPFILFSGQAQDPEVQKLFRSLPPKAFVQKGDTDELIAAVCNGLDDFQGKGSQPPCDISVKN